MIPLKNLDAYLNTSDSSSHACRSGCAACCIAPSISSTTAAMPKGKPAGVACVHLNAQLLCKLFATTKRPKVCSDFGFDLDVCGKNREQALKNLNWLEEQTAS
ncbi:MAG TPA: YkgJ family cysteine cluster protein [Marinospirillum sp.]|uniref:YkgJ family cysteine cluster protein n=1 Tax=Marinospirillum sp. TaxID=2183934 RepID=UPI002B45DE6A|nr:YkgJ family cysteine cluster protein [Marinospirillum sp.]HKM15407.1 YkgJ family cysteine cluster protein [Marinospirillum sp.]